MGELDMLFELEFGIELSWFMLVIERGSDEIEGALLRCIGLVGGVR